MAPKVGGSNPPNRTTQSRSILVTWFTFDTGEMVYTFSEPLISLTIHEIVTTTSKMLEALGAHQNIALHTHSIQAVRSLVATSVGVSLLADLVYRP